MHLLGRDRDLHVYSPPGLDEIINVSHHHSNTHLNYKIVFHVIEEKIPALIFENGFLSVTTIPMNHRIPCYGFLFQEKQGLKNIIKEKITEYDIPVQEIPGIKEGNDFITSSGKKIPNTELALDPPLPKMYAYCSDTLYNESYFQQIKNADLLYHEATFADDMKDRAKETHHCTAKEAGAIALKANVKRLIIGHYSARYHDLSPLLSQAKEVFENTVLAVEGETYIV